MLLPNILVHCELSPAFAHWWRQTFLDALASLRPISDSQQFWDKVHHASSRCVLSRKWLQLTGKVWWLESYQCEETSGSTRVVQQSKLIYDIDTLSNSGMCDMWKVLFSGKLKLRRWILFFLTCSQTIPEVLILKYENIWRAVLFTTTILVWGSISVQNPKSVRCEGKVDWSCSVLRPRPR